MSKVFLFRHGQTTDNKTHTFSGTRDVDLTPEGQEEAKKIGKELKSVIPTIAYHSGKLRSIKTLDLVLGNKKQGIKIIKDARIRERDYGDLTGQNKDEVAKKHPHEYPLWHRSYEFGPPNGESIKDVEKRVMEFLKEELPKWKKNDVVFISAHGNSIRPMRRYFEGLTVKQMCSFEHTPRKSYRYKI
ncbi:2,3-bisphosphoglycerate-dependent phosphoglycerate mutase [Patescibacteria group bacterium]|nr:2,3-bisphosphoglycerate-dependent phosphoglycerate mutase [Patescibacteria group bacterium]